MVNTRKRFLQCGVLQSAIVAPARLQWKLFFLLMYIYDLQEGIYIWEPDMMKRCNMGAMLEKANMEVNRIAEENYLPL